MNIFDSLDYKNYLKTRLDERRGLRSELAEFLGCQSGYVSQVLQNLSDFSLEQGMKTSSFLLLSAEESHFFMLLLQYEKASTQDLKKYFKDQIERIQNERKEIKNRIKIDTDLSAEDYHQYYSSWEYAALHILTSIPKYQTKDMIGKKLQLNQTRIEEVLNFLTNKGLVEEKNNKFIIGNKRIHLTKNSPYILSHHQNWRLHSTRMLSDRNSKNLNYSGVFSLSISDIDKIREILLRAIEQNEKIISSSGEEEMIYLGIDMNIFNK